MEGLTLVDPAEVMARALALRAYGADPSFTWS
jgi:hypothetical protein